MEKSDRSRSIVSYDEDDQDIEMEDDRSQSIVLYESKNLSFSSTVRGIIFTSLIVLVLVAMGSNVFALVSTFSYTEEIQRSAEFCLTPGSSGAFPDQAAQLESELLSSYQRKASTLLSVTSGKLDGAGRRLSNLHRGASMAAREIYPGFASTSSSTGNNNTAASVGSVDLLTAGLNTTRLNYMIGVVVAQMNEDSFLGSFAAPSAQTDAASFISVVRSSRCSYADAASQCVFVFHTSGSGSTVYYNYSAAATTLVGLSTTWIQQFSGLDAAMEKIQGEHRAAFQYAASLEAKAGVSSGETFADYWTSNPLTVNVSGASSTTSSLSTASSSSGYLSLFYKTPFHQQDLDLGYMYSITSMPTLDWELALDTANSLNSWDGGEWLTPALGNLAKLQQQRMTPTSSILAIKGAVVHLVNLSTSTATSVDWGGYISSSVVQGSTSAKQLLSDIQNGMPSTAVVNRTIQGEGFYTTTVTAAGGGQQVALQWYPVSIGGFKATATPTTWALVLALTRDTMHTSRAQSLATIQSEVEEVKKTSIGVFVAVTVLVAMAVVVIAVITVRTTAKTTESIQSLAENLTHVATMELEKATIFQHPEEAKAAAESNVTGPGAETGAAGFDRKQSVSSLVRKTTTKPSRNGETTTETDTPRITDNESGLVRGESGSFVLDDRKSMGAAERQKHPPAPILEAGVYSGVREIAAVQEACNKMISGLKEYRKYLPATLFVNSELPPLEDLADELVDLDDNDSDNATGSDAALDRTHRENDELQAAVMELAGIPTGVTAGNSPGNPAVDASPLSSGCDEGTMLTPIEKFTGSDPTQRTTILAASSPASSSVQSPDQGSLRGAASQQGSPKHGPTSPKIPGWDPGKKVAPGDDLGGTYSAMLQGDLDLDEADTAGRFKTSALEFGLRRRRVTVVAVSFAGFLKLSQESMGEAHALSQMFLQLVLQVVEKRAGVVLHLTADRVVATWNAFKHQPHHEAKAAQCAVDINRTLQAADDEFLISDVQWVVAVTSGIVLAGNSGTLTERASVAQGSCIDLATELLALMLGIGLKVVCTQAVREHLPGRMYTIPVDSITENDDTVTRLHELHLGEEPAHVSEIRVGFGHLEANNYDQAIEVFTKVFRVTADPHALRLLKISLLFSELNTPYIRTMPAWQSFESDVETMAPDALGTTASMANLLKGGASHTRVRYKSEKRQSGMADEHLRMELMKLQNAKTSSAATLLTAESHGNMRTPRGRNLGPPAIAVAASSLNSQPNSGGNSNSNSFNIPFVNSVNSPNGHPFQLSQSGSPTFGSPGGRIKRQHSDKSNPPPTSPKISDNTSDTTSLQILKDPAGSPTNLGLPETLERKPSIRRRFPSFMVAVPSAPDDKQRSGGSTPRGALIGGSTLSSFRMSATPSIPGDTAGTSATGSQEQLPATVLVSTGSLPAAQQGGAMGGTSSQSSLASNPSFASNPKTNSGPASGPPSHVSSFQSTTSPQQSPSASSLPQGPTPPPVTEFTDRKNMVFRMSENVLGRGATGQVVLGMTESGGLVAIKVVPIPKQAAKEKQKELTAMERRRLKRKGVVAHANVEETIEEVLKEVTVLSKLRHECIVGYLSSSLLDEGKKLVVAMEYISGGSLASLLTEFKAVPIQTARRYMRDVLRGLQFLHEQDILHRDIKPHNVLLLIDGSCKLTDFGTADSMAKLSGGTGGLQGTPQYMSPEAARNKDIGKASDIWSFGIMLAQIINGDLPWVDGADGFSPIRFLFQLANAEDCLPTVPASTPKDVADVVTQCCQRDQTKRPSCAELLQLPFFTVVAPTPVKKKQKDRLGASTLGASRLGASRLGASGLGTSGVRAMGELEKSGAGGMGQASPFRRVNPSEVATNNTNPWDRNGNLVSSGSALSAPSVVASPMAAEPSQPIKIVPPTPSSSPQPVVLNVTGSPVSPQREESLPSVTSVTSPPLQTENTMEPMHSASSGGTPSGSGGIGSGAFVRVDSDSSLQSGDQAKVTEAQPQLPSVTGRTPSPDGGLGDLSHTLPSIVIS